MGTWASIEGKGRQAVQVDTLQVETHKIDGILIGELIASGEPVNSSQDILDLLGTFDPEHVEALMLHATNLAPEFFQLRTKLALPRPTTT